MFTGIIEALGKVIQIEKEGTNKHFTIESSISSEFKVDQSISHNGVCLTVVEIGDNWHKVTAIEETLKRSNLGHIKVNDFVNLERSMLSNGRLDGHIVQGHVDATGECTNVEVLDGSWYYTFNYKPAPEHILVDKGSICVNGVSLTVVEPENNTFKVAIIPYTYEHTTFKNIKAGTIINLEFDVIGKYVAKYLHIYAPKNTIGNE